MFDFSDMIHEERSKRLRSLPQFSGTVLSAGCAGSWYFKWFEECTGHQGKHVGLELYSEEPTGLPANVDWISNSVGDMKSIGDSSVDLLFSGQNIEHLPQQDLTGFLLESNRVVKDDGLLIIDSPNRSTTQHLGYVQIEHTLEVRANEAVELIEAAGFEVFEVHGIWLVIDPHSLRTFDIFSCKAGELSYATRQNLASQNPDKSFIWWINARKKRPADENLVRQLSEQLFWRNYKGFVSARFDSKVGTTRWNWGGSVISIAVSEEGYALHGPYIPMAAGAYQASFHVKGSKEGQNEGAELTLDVVSSQGTRKHGKLILNSTSLSATKSWHEFVLPFVLPTYTTGLEARIFSKNFRGLVSGTVDFLSD